MKRVLTAVSILTLGQAPEVSAARYEGQALLHAAHLDKPNDPDIFVADPQNLYRLSLRESGKFTFKRGIAVEAAAYLITEKLSGNDDLDHLAMAYTDLRNRSTSLDKIIVRQKKQETYVMIDRLNIKFSLKRLRLTLGRSAIDLSKSFIFRPNDIFAPSRSNQIDRFHKLGVDSVQLTGPLNPLGEWKILAVAGYEEQKTTSIDFESRLIEPENRFSASQSSLLGSYLNTFGGYSLQLTAGMHQSGYLLMAAVEGQLTDSLGLRTEAKQWDKLEDNLHQFSATIGLDFRVSSSLLLLSEVFVNGEGLDSIEEAQTLSFDPYAPISQYGKYYLGLGLNYEITAKLGFQSLAQINLSDTSILMTGSFGYSLSELLELGLLLATNKGEAPKDGLPQSEYGSYPQAIALEAVMRW